MRLANDKRLRDKLFTPESYQALRVSHKAMLEVLVQILEEVMYPIDKLIPEVESTIATAEKLEQLHLKS